MGKTTIKIDLTEARKRLDEIYSAERAVSLKRRHFKAADEKRKAAKVKLDEALEWMTDCIEEQIHGPGVLYEED